MLYWLLGLRTPVTANQATWETPGDVWAYPTATTSSACPTATNPRALPTTTNSGDSSPQWAGAFGACDAAKTLPGGANSARSWGSRKHLSCGCGSAAARQTSRWRQSPPRPSISKKWKMYSEHSEHFEGFWKSSSHLVDFVGCSYWNHTQRYCIHNMTGFSNLV